MNLKLLRKFVVLADEGNFTRASALLHLSQPALSKQIALLEDHMGARLLERGRRPVVLTEAGQRTYAGAVMVLKIVDQMQVDVRRLAHRGRDTVTIAFAPAVVYAGISDVMKRLTLANPHLDIQWREMLSGEQAAALRSGDIDIAFGPWHGNETDIVRVPQRSERLFVAIPADDVLARDTGPIGLHELDGRVLLAYPGLPDQGFPRQTLALFSDAKVQPSAVTTVPQIGFALAFVAAERGVCLIPASSRHLRADIHYRPLDHPNAFMEIVMAHRADEDSEFVESVKVVIRQFFADGPDAIDAAYNQVHVF